MIDDSDIELTKINPLFEKTAQHVSIVDRDETIDMQDLDDIDTMKQLEKSNDKKSNHKPKKDYIVDDLEKPWNYRIMLQLKTIGERSLGYKWMHNEELMYYAQRLKMLTILEIVLTTLHATSIAGSIVSLFNNTNIYALMIILTCIQTVLFICTNIIKTWKEAAEYPTKIYDHRWSCIKFGQIATQIQNQFCLHVSKRNNDENFLEYKSTDFDDALFGAPIIRSVTMKQYLDGTKDSNIIKPLSLGNIGNIEIVVDKNEDCEGKSKEDKSKNMESKYNHEMDRFLRFC